MLTFESDSHTYRFAGEEIPSVTQLLKCLRNFDWVTPEQLAAAGERGTDVDAACTLDDMNDLVEDSVSPQIMPFLEGWRKFKRDCKPEIVEIQLPLYHPVFRYAGTLDRVLILNGALTLLDIKTGVQSKVTGLQLAGYKLAWDVMRPGTPIQRAVALHLTKRGDYKIVHYDDISCQRTFIALVTLHQWSKENSI